MNYYDNSVESRNNHEKVKSNVQIVVGQNQETKNYTKETNRKYNKTRIVRIFQMQFGIE